jgi:two-component system, cell cycle sensor histidine kinase and response regulator CckA
LTISPTWFRKAYPEPRHRHNVIEAWLNDMERFRQDPSLTEGRQRTFTVTSKDNTQKIINFISVQLSTGECLMTYEDITELKQLQTQLLHSQKMEAIGALAGGVAHDFNNILTAIIGYTTLAKMKLSDNNPVQHYLEDVLSAAEKATDLTRSLLAFSRKQIINPKNIDINETIRKVKKLLSRLIDDDIELHCEPSKERLVVMADQVQVEQILMNLVTNARDAMPEGGSLSIDTRTVILNERFVESHGYGIPGRHALIIVSDSGTGMDEATKGKIFEPFFTTKEIGKGTGLGLSTTYGIVRQHGGYIEVESEPEQGTTFKIYLPLVESDVTTLPSKIKKSVSGGKESILIAEDDNNVRTFMRDLLERYGYTVFEAINGEDAVIKCKGQKNNINLVILDTVMPKKNGKEAYKEIQEMVVDMPVLFTSGYTHNITQQKGITAGKVDFIQKPFVYDSFLQKIRELLDRRVTGN